MTKFGCLLLLLCITRCYSFLFPTSASRRSSSMIMSTIVPSNDKIKEPWWRDGLKFGCTACGRCCQNEGEVWMDSDEFADLTLHLQKSPLAVLNEYVEMVENGWVKIKSGDRVRNKEGNLLDDRCIFLGEDGKACSIYEARPIQCRTYPFWPKLIMTPEGWDKEGVVPDDMPGRHWSPDGGCEGVNAIDAPIINAKIIHRNHELYRYYHDVFPFMTSGDDNNKLLAKVGVLNGVVKATKAWVQQFVLRHNLCPFAESVFVDNKIRYRVFLGTDKGKIIERLRYEMLALLTTKEEDVATTLLMLPFALNNFEEFHEFSLDLEDLVLPSIERDLQGPSPSISPDTQRQGLGSNPSPTTSIGATGTPTKRRSLLQRKSSQQGGSSPSVSSEGSGGCPVVHMVEPSNKNGMQSSQPFAESSSSGRLRSSLLLSPSLPSTSLPSSSISTTILTDISSQFPPSLPLPSLGNSNNKSNNNNNNNSIFPGQQNNDKMEPLPEIQLAFFHPGFQWADSEEHDPLNFEKRAPFPTINLLRAAKIRDYANEQKTKVSL